MNLPLTNMKGKWREMYFHNDNPIVLELGCGKGEYTVELAKLYPHTLIIGLDRENLTGFLIDTLLKQRGSRWQAGFAAPWHRSWR